ncbi:MAG: hypothetical protein HZB13_05465 [Acidobacteria bacterium]|nr:hypothetical protein [Acidobacteriota bacterium]
MNNGYLLIRAVRGPLMLMALGGLMALHRFYEVSFYKTWPALLILLGVMKLLERLAMRPTGPATPEGGTGMGPFA